MYNYDYLIATLLFLMLILIHLIRQKNLIDYTNRIFSFYIMVGIIDISFDIISSVMAEYGGISFQWLTEMVFVIFYIMQILVIFLVVYYTKSQESKEHTNKNSILIYIVPAFLMVLLILSNHFTHLFFYFDEQGAYHTGRFYLLMYIYSLLSVLMMLVDLWINRRYMEQRKRIIILELLAIMGACVVVQAMVKGLLMTGLGIGLGIVLLVLTLNNPQDFMDTKTGIYTHNYFNILCQEMLEKKQEIGLLVVGVKNIKQVNHIFGVALGDQYLQNLGKKLLQIDGSKHVFSMNGAKYAILVNPVSQFQQYISAIKDISGSSEIIHNIEITFDLKVCGIHDVKDFKNADDLWTYGNYLYETALSGSDVKYIESNDEYKKNFYYVQEVEKYLYKAVEEDLFEIYLQLIYSPVEHRYVSGELLSRLFHPELGAVRPDIFIILAEKNGLIGEITVLQFEKICRIIRDHPILIKKLHNIKMNFSPANLIKKGMAEKVIKKLKEYDIPCSFFQIEITETIATEYSEILLDNVEKLSEAGIGICLDDFGSGYANMSSVLQLPFSCIKMDRSLLRRIDTDSNAAFFYQNIVQTFKNMNYKIVAEGVSNEKEKDFVTKLGIDLIQGFYYSKPQPIPSVIEQLRN